MKYAANFQKKIIFFENSQIHCNYYGMRKLFIHSLILFVSWSLAGAQPAATVCTETEVSLPVCSIQQKGLPAVSIEQSASCRLTLGPFTSFGAATLKNTSFAELANLCPSDASSFCDSCASFTKSFISLLTPSWGANLHLGNEKTFCTTDLLVGLLRFSGSFSRLKDPRFSASSAVRRPVSFSPGINPSLPSKTPPSTGPAVALRLAPVVQMNFVPTLECAYFFSGEYLASVSSSFYKERMSITGSATVCMTTFSGEESSSWFAERPRFSSVKLPAFELDSSLSLPFFHSSSAVGIHADPFGGGVWWFRTHNGVSLGTFYLGTSFFAAGDLFYTADGTCIDTKYQISVNPQYTFSAGKNSVRMGILCAADTKQSAPTEASVYHFRFETSLRREKMTFSSHAAVSYEVESAKPTYTGGISLHRTTPLLKTTCSAGAQKCGSKSSCSLSASFSGATYSAASGGASVSFHLDDNALSATDVSISTSLRGSSRRIKWVGKMVFFITF